MTAGAYRLPVVPAPEQHLVAAMGLDVIHKSRIRHPPINKADPCTPLPSPDRQTQQTQTNNSLRPCYAPPGLRKVPTLPQSVSARCPVSGASRLPAGFTPARLVRSSPVAMPVGSVSRFCAGLVGAGSSTGRGKFPGLSSPYLVESRASPIPLLGLQRSKSQTMKGRCIRVGPVRSWGLVTSMHLPL